VSEYELGASGLPRASVSPQQPSKNWLKIEKNHDFCKKEKRKKRKKESGAMTPGGSGDFYLCRMSC
jgi:hypothetical protein